MKDKKCSWCNGTGNYYDNKDSDETNKKVMGFAICPYCAGTGIEIPLEERIKNEINDNNIFIL